MILLRTFDADLGVGDGRTIVGRCIPFDAEATVRDGDGPPYREVWRSGAFRHVLKAPHLVRMNFEHQEDLANQVGLAVELDERDDGLYGTFRAYEHGGGPLGLEMIAAGNLRGLSVAVRMHERGSREGPGIVERVRVAQLDHVALTGRPAFAGAEVTAVRTGEPEPAATPALNDVLDWVARAGAKYARVR